jgi:poly(3-hydroxybutyrate) depolymerase
MIVFHGSADTTVYPSNAGRIIASHGGSLGNNSRSEHGPSGETRAYTRLVAERDDGTHGVECWMIEGAQHAWSGGHPSGSYTDPRGPNASAALIHFFLDGASDVAGA